MVLSSEPVAYKRPHICMDRAMKISLSAFRWKFSETEKVDMVLTVDLYLYNFPV